ncbi:SEL1-like repeat protein [Microvirga puerhi]|uniref:Localization factor PodJL n=1 Tax=Microvirga puerhi TaxID=2876078 RepID=A0ABS7VST6_9HYPH|nr:hypothetical protein [Microvirga puerhi]MBZ6078611.1 hypothetical protein [Microvirga puerhi]
MRRPDPAHLDALDPETRAAAEKAALRAGLSLEDWVARVVSRSGEEPSLARSEGFSESELSSVVSSRPCADPPGREFETIMATARAAEAERRPDQASRDTVVLESMALWIEQAEERLSEATRLSTHQRNRLDAVERQVAAVSDPARATGSPEDAMKTLAPVTDALTSLRTDVSRLTKHLDQPSPAAFGEIRQDIDRLRAGLEKLASRSEVSTLNETFRLLARDLERGPSSKDLLTLAGSVAGMNRRIENLSNAVTDNTHRHIGAEIDFIRGKIERLSETSVDRSVIDFLSSQIVDLRQDLAQRAEPQQIDALAQSLADLDRRLADMQASQVSGRDLATLRSSLEDVCAALNRSVLAQEQSDVPQQLQDISLRLDQLVSRPVPEPANLDPIAEQLATLTEHMAHMVDGRLEQTETINGLFNRLSTQISAAAEATSSLRQPLLERFERLEEELRRADPSALAQMLRSLQAKLDQPAPSLTALDERIASVSEQLSRTPEIYRQAFEEAIGHVATLQNDTARIAEQAVAAAVRDASVGPNTASELEALKAGFAEIKALQLRADRKTQQALIAVHDALETLVTRVAVPPTAAANSSTKAASDLPPPDRLEAAVRRLHASALSQIEDIAATIPKPVAPDHQPNEAGTPRVTPAESEDEALADVRASFIAAARRASRTLASAPADLSVSENERLLEIESDQVSSTPELLAAPSSEAPRGTPSLFERLRRTLDAHRRSLLLGLALLVLGTGTAQILSNAPHASASGATEPVVDAAPSMAQADEGTGSIVPTAVAADQTGLFEPTHLSGTPVTAESFVTSKFTVDPGTLGTMPAEIPDALRQAALAGDGTAVYEIALRALEGRGLPRDPTLALRLFERAAQAGLVPAQERLAIMYDKAIGTPRDVKLASAWYERAAQGGNVRAMHNLATLLAAGISGKPDYATALQWYTEAAQAGVRDSQFNIGVLYARGVGARKDPAKAFQWFALAAAQGDAEAAKKRDEMASRLSPADLATAKTMVEKWRPRSTDPLANEVPSRGGDRTADSGADLANKS